MGLDALPWAYGRTLQPRRWYLNCTTVRMRRCGKKRVFGGKGRLGGVGNGVGVQQLYTRITWTVGCIEEQWNVRLPGHQDWGLQGSTKDEYNGLAVRRS